MSKFALDLAQGKAAEKRVADKMLAAGIYQKIEFAKNGKFSEYDAVGLTRDGVTKYLEMKNDMKSALTGNFFVEFWCGDKPSGIDVTKADYYVVTTHKPMQFWQLPVDKLSKIAKKCKIVSGGDESKAKGYLVPVSQLPKEYRLDI